MKQEDLEKLAKSIKQAGTIKKGEIPPSRRYEFEPMDIKTIRKELNQSQSEFALLIGVSVSTLQNLGTRKT